MLECCCLFVLCVCFWGGVGGGVALAVTGLDIIFIYIICLCLCVSLLSAFTSTCVYIKKRHSSMFHVSLKPGVITDDSTPAVESSFRVCISWTGLTHLAPEENGHLRT